ncbi:hypothetical protein BD769DRAFT_1396428 [Suillus cothurnatus]|nr:hypothetical protein BD769DRAFT_1396428 [Suillus cothurnatus]
MGKKQRLFEWVHDLDHSDDESHGRMIIRVGQDLAIYPLDERSVQVKDGSLPMMSYWYGKLLKVKDTIQDVNGECSLKITGQLHKGAKGCPVVPHYHLPLYALNMKFGPKIHYMATLDLPHWTITCGWITQLMDFMMSVVRPSMQGYGQGKDITSLLCEVDACVKAEEVPMCIDSPDPKSCTEALLYVRHTCLISSSTQTNSQNFHCHTIWNNKTSLATLGDCPCKILICGFRVWLTSHIAMQICKIQELHCDDPLDNLFSDRLLLTAWNSNEFLEMLGMAEMMNIAMAQFFTAIGGALYELHSVNACIVGYGQMLLPSHLIENSCTFRIPKQDMDSMENSEAFNTTMDIDMHSLDAQKNSEAIAMPMDINMQLNSRIFVTLLLWAYNVQDSFGMGDLIHGNNNITEDIVCKVSSQPQDKELYGQYTICLSESTSVIAVMQPE